MLEAPSSAPMELRDYLGILKRRAWVIFLVTAIVVGVAAVWAYDRTDEYKASGTVVVAPTGGDTIDVDNQAGIMGSQAVHALAVQANPEVGDVDAEPSSTGTTITVTSTDKDPTRAADTVNAHIDAYLVYLRQQAQAQYDAVAKELVPQINALQAQINAIDAQGVLVPLPPGLANQRNTLSSQLGGLQSQVQTLQLKVTLAGKDVQVVARATPPNTPSSPDPRSQILVALGAGLLLGVAVAFLLEFIDDSIRSRQDLLAAAGNAVPVMGLIPATRSSRPDVVSISAPQSPVAEAYRSLRTAVSFAKLTNGNCIEVTSARSREGKTETVANLAVLAARAGQRVVVVDCDLRLPRVHEYFGLSNTLGFTSVVQGEPLSNALQRVPGAERVYVLPSGPLPSNPSELLVSERCHEVLASLQADDTLVIVDTPPVLAVTDAAALAPSAGGLLVVAANRVTRRKQVRQTLEILRQIGAPVLGLVLYGAGSAETGGYGQGAGRRERRQVRRLSADQAATTASAP